MKAREREQRKEEDNITTVVKRSKRRVTRMCVCKKIKSERLTLM